VTSIISAIIAVSVTVFGVVIAELLRPRPRVDIDPEEPLRSSTVDASHRHGFGLLATTRRRGVPMKDEGWK